MMPDSAVLIDHRNSRPGKRMGAGALVRDTHGRVLIVEPTYKDRWEVPGGAVEAASRLGQCAAVLATSACEAQPTIIDSSQQ